MTNKAAVVRLAAVCLSALVAASAAVAQQDGAEGHQEVAAAIAGSERVYGKPTIAIFHVDVKRAEIIELT